MKSIINSFLKENQISLLKNYLISNKKKLEKTNYKEFLGIIELNLGNYDEAKKKFTDVNKESTKEYVEFIDEVVYKTYIPLYNKIINSISKNTCNKEDIKKLLDQAIKVYSNTEIFELAVIYFMINNDKKLSLNYSKIGIEIDSTNLVFKEVIKKNERKKYTRKKYLLGIASILALTFISYEISLYNELFENNKRLNSNLSRALTKTTNINNQLSKSISKTKKLKSKNIQLTQILEKNERKKTILSTNELYNLGLKRYKNEKYDEAINLLRSIENENLPLFKEKEIIFILAMSYNKIKNYDEAISYFEYFKKNYNKDTFNEYLEICNYNLGILKEKI